MPSCNVKVRVRRGRHNGRDTSGNVKTFEKGDVFMTTKARYLAFRDKLELLDAGGEAIKDAGKGGSGKIEFDAKKAKKDELIAKLEELGVEFDKDAKVDELRELVEEEIEARNGDNE